METLTSSSSSATTKNIFAAANAYSRSGDFSTIGVCRFPKKTVDFSQSISLRFLSKLSESISSNTQANVADAETLAESTYQSKTVRVKFQLQKECVFGEQFLLVGDDPSIGLWDPAIAIPLDWTDEHIWTVELDLPIGKFIRFKFVLKGTAENIFWQPGPDRALETWDTKNIIVVLEDWENTEIQKITEEPSKDFTVTPDRNLNAKEAEPEAFDKKGVAIADNVTHPTEEPVVNESMESITTSTTNLVAENILVRTGDLVGYVREPVLVLGLTPLPNITTEEFLSKNPESNCTFKASSGTDEAEDPGMAKPYENQEHEKQEVDGIPNQEETTFTMVNMQTKEKQHDNELEGKKRLNVEHQQPVDDVLQSDFNWGRKTLSKLLTTLGFPLDQT